MESKKQKLAIEMLLRIASHLAMEINEVHNGSPMVSIIRNKQILTMIHCTSIISGVSVDELTNQFNAMLNESVKDYDRHTRILDGDEILKNILDEEES
jgi:hypothetical protein